MLQVSDLGDSDVLNESIRLEMEMGLYIYFIKIATREQKRVSYSLPPFRCRHLNLAPFIFPSDKTSPPSHSPIRSVPRRKGSTAQHKHAEPMCFMEG